MMKKQTTLLLPLLLLAWGAKAQSVGPSTLNAAGGSATIAGNTYEYSIGEMSLVHTATAGSLVVTQGVLQPKMDPSGIRTLTLDGHVSLFPNPTESTVYLQPAFAGKTTLVAELWDAAGKLLLQRSIVLSTGKEKQSFSLAGYAAGTYMLQVNATSEGKTYAGAYKIQKLN